MGTFLHRFVGNASKTHTRTWTILLFNSIPRGRPYVNWTCILMHCIRTRTQLIGTNSGNKHYSTFPQNFYQNLTSHPLHRAQNQRKTDGLAHFFLMFWRTKAGVAPLKHRSKQFGHGNGYWNGSSNARIDPWLHLWACERTVSHTQYTENVRYPRSRE
jgi:hypothetical protein